jgi:G:T/U-mismatch repair DNA glycosylase
MHKLSFYDALHAGRLFSSLTIAALAVRVRPESSGVTWAQTAERDPHNSARVPRACNAGKQGRRP